MSSNTYMETAVAMHLRKRIGFLGASLAVIGIFFVVPIFEKNFYSCLALHVCFSLLILSTLYAIEVNSFALATGFFLLTPLVYFECVGFQQKSYFYMMLSYGFSLVFTLFAIIVVMKRILYTSRVRVNLIFGALMVYLFAGILWANLYFVENIAFPGSFEGVGIVSFSDEKFNHVYEQHFNFLYYSFATLATLGMGDIIPLSHLAKSLTAVESMFGQLFVAVIIAKLVSAWRNDPASAGVNMC